MLATVSSASEKTAEAVRLGALLPPGMMRNSPSACTKSSITSCAVSEAVLVPPNLDSVESESPADSLFCVS